MEIQSGPRSSPELRRISSLFLLFLLCHPPIALSDFFLCRCRCRCRCRFVVFHLSMEPSAKKRKLAPKVNASPAPNSQPSVPQYTREPSVSHCNRQTSRYKPVHRACHMRSKLTRLGSYHKASIMQFKKPRSLNGRTLNPSLAISKTLPCLFSARLNDRLTMMSRYYC